MRRSILPLRGKQIIVNRQEGTQVLERLLQRNPTHPIGLQLLQQIRAGG